AAIDLDQPDVRFLAPEVEAGLAAPETGAERQPGVADVLEAPGAGDVADVRLESLLARLGEPLLGRDPGRIERRHHVSAVRPAAAESAMQAGPGVEPGRRHDDGVDERPLDAVKRR